MELISHKDLAKLIPVSDTTLRLYLCRDEFCLLDRVRKNRRIYYGGITQKVIDRLRQLANIDGRKHVIKKTEDIDDMASIKRCIIKEVVAQPEQDLYKVTVEIGTKEVKVFDYYHNGSTNIIDFVKDELKKISRFNRLDERLY